MMCQISRKQLQSLRPKAENGEPIVFYKKMQARVLDCKICKNILIHFEAFSLQRCSSDFSRHGTNMNQPNGSKRIFFQADYYRYLAEFLENDGKKEVLSLRFHSQKDAFVDLFEIILKDSLGLHARRP